MEQDNNTHPPGDILIIDDAPASLELLAGMLADAGYTIRTAMDGMAGLQSVQAKVPDLILLDIRMPGIDGFEVCRRLKASPDTTSIPVIFLTVVQDEESKIQGFRLGAADYIPKPCSHEEIMARVHTHITLHRLQVNLQQQVQLRTIKLEEEIAERKRIEEELQHSERSLAESQHLAHIGSWEWNVITDTAYWSEETYRLFGIPHGQLADHRHNFLDMIHPEDKARVSQALNDALAGNNRYNVEYRITLPDKTEKTIHALAGVNRNGEGKPVLMYGTVQDITERKRAENSLRLQSEITANAAEGIALIKVNDGTIYYTNRQFDKLFGYDPGELIGKPISVINAPTAKSPEETAREISQAVMDKGAWNGEVHNLRKDGTRVWTSADVSTFQHPELGTLLITYQRDITDKKKSEETIWKQANFDMLTGLPNRHMFHDHLTQEIRKANRLNQKLALMFVDLDRFKEINDTLGHDMGDVLLIEAAQRIRECIRATDMVARMGGDEFTITLSEFSDISFIERVAQAILQQLTKPFKLGSEVAYISGSVGITIYPDDALELEDLLKNADQSMYEAKNLGRNRHSYFTHKMQETAQTRMSMINDLRGALLNGQLSICFQPIVEIASGNIYKAEALVRWKHPERGQVPPSSFIPLAEETGLIFEIGDWVFEESVSWAKRWREIINPEFQVSINKSPVQFYSQSAEHSTWVEHLQSLGLPGNSITIEITEGLLMNNDSIIGDILFNFRDKGIQISVDDFGTGYSSLAYLNRFNVDYLKIDQSFTRNITPDSNDMALVEAIIVMAHKLGLRVIAEGVETREQRDLLASVGCDFAQGYLFSRPIPPNEFEALLKNWKSPQ